MSKKDYKVIFTVTSTHTYVVPECNTPEEAESIAEDWFAEGDTGDVEDTDVDTVDVFEYTGGEE